MTEWISVNDCLPSPDIDVWATDGKNVEMGFRSYADTHKTRWLDYWFTVSHWMPCEGDVPPMPPEI